MVKVKTITCHNVYNYGASLQAYALNRYLRDIGHDAEIIDYRPNYLSGHFNYFAISSKWNNTLIKKLFYYSIKIPQRFFNLNRRIKKRKFDFFRDNYMRLTPSTYYSNEEMKINKIEASIFIAGSDQIWNTNYSNGKDPAFYLDFADKEAIKASYAASFSIQVIENNIKPFVHHHISSLDYVSVREKTGLSILEDLGIKDAVKVVDPVFLLPKSHWDNLSTAKLISKKYILIYDFEGNELIKQFALKLAKDNALKIISVRDGAKLTYADKIISSAGPLEFLSLIKNCEIFLSCSFHGTAFSLIFEKDFFVFDRIRQQVNSRMRDLLSDLSLKDRIISDIDCINTILPKIDYIKVNSILEETKNKSQQYLNNLFKK